MLTEFTAVTDSAESALLSTGAAADQETLSSCSRSGCDVDHTVDGVCAPERSTRSANDFDAVDIFQRQILNVPIHTGEERGVNTAAVDEHKELVGKFVIETAGTDRPGMRVLP